MLHREEGSGLPSGGGLAPCGPQIPRRVGPGIPSPDVFTLGWGIWASLDKNVWGLSKSAGVYNPQTFLSGDGQIPSPDRSVWGLARSAGVDNPQTFSSGDARIPHPQTKTSGDCPKVLGRTIPRHFCLGMPAYPIPRQKRLGVVSPDQNVWGFVERTVLTHPQTFLSGGGDLGSHSAAGLQLAPAVPAPGPRF